jgi:hypothetical protein
MSMDPGGTNSSACGQLERTKIYVPVKMTTYDPDSSSIPDDGPFTASNHPLHQPHRRYLHRLPHTAFARAATTSTVSATTTTAATACTACSTLAETFQCTRCPLTLCHSCVELITSPLIRGNLGLLVSRVARWKFGFSSTFLARVGGLKPVEELRVEYEAKVLLGGGSLLRCEVKEWDSEDDEDDTESDSGSSSNCFSADKDIEEGGIDGGAVVSDDMDRLDLGMPALVRQSREVVVRSSIRRGLGEAEDSTKTGRRRSESDDCSVVTSPASIGRAVRKTREQRAREVISMMKEEVVDQTTKGMAMLWEFVPVELRKARS